MYHDNMYDRYRQLKAFLKYILCGMVFIAVSMILITIATVLISFYINHQQQEIDVTVNVTYRGDDGMGDRGKQNCSIYKDIPELCKNTCFCVWCELDPDATGNSTVNVTGTCLDEGDSSNVQCPGGLVHTDEKCSYYHVKNTIILGIGIISFVLLVFFIVLTLKTRANYMRSKHEYSRMGLSGDELKYDEDHVELEDVEAEKRRRKHGISTVVIPFTN